MQLRQRLRSLRSKGVLPGQRFGEERVERRTAQDRLAGTLSCGWVMGQAGLLGWWGAWGCAGGSGVWLVAWTGAFVLVVGERFRVFLS